MSNESILIVEDERIVADDMRETLRQMGYTIIGIESTGESAVTSAVTLRPDLVLMDIFLAGPMNGIEAARIITQQQEVPIIFLTAFADSQIIDKAKVIQPYGYILKPYDERELKTAIEIALFKFALDRKLKESEERYRGFVQNFLGIAFRLNPDLTPVFLHGSVEAITGFTEQEFLAGSPSWESIVHREELEGLCVKNRQIASGSVGAATREYRIVRKDGKERWLSELIQYVSGTDRSAGYIQGSRYDITERKEAEKLLVLMNEELEARVQERTQSLADQIQFLQQLIDTIPSPVFYKDISGKYLGCNAAFEVYLGKTRKEIIGKNDAALLPADLAEVAFQKDRFLIKNRGIQVYQSKYLHADRTIRDVIFKRATFNNAEGTIAGLIGVMLDITDRIKAEEDLLKSERRFREVVQDQTELIVRFRPDWTVIFANDAFLTYFSKKQEDITGHIFHPPFHHDDEQLFQMFIANLIQNVPFGTTESRTVLPDGTILWQQWNIRAFFDENGQVDQFQAVGSDITERRENERILKESYTQIERNLRQFAVLNDHIRNPLAVIMMLIELHETQNTKKIMEQITEIDRIINQLDRGFLESEKIRGFLKKHYGIDEISGHQ